MAEPVTVVILTKNEESALPRCLAAIPEGFPVLVLDSGSTDRTLDVARQHGCAIREHAWEGYAQQRNYALRECGIASEWVLFIDADEVFPKPLFDWVESALEGELADADAVMLPSYFYLRGRCLKHAPGYPIYHARLLRRERVEFLSHHDGGFGENIRAGCRIRHGKIPYEHYFYDGELLAWMHKHVDHANRETRTHGTGITINPRKRLSLLLGNSAIRAPARFAYHYLIRGGFLDGRAGLEFSLMFAWYEATRYLLARFGEGMSANSAEGSAQKARLLSPAPSGRGLG